MLINILLDKHKIISQLKEDLKEISSEKEFTCLEYPIEKISFNRLLPSIRNNYHCYFKAKLDQPDQPETLEKTSNINDYECLGIGVLESFRGISSTNKITNIIEQNKTDDLIFMGGQNFCQSTVNKEEWSAFSNVYYFLPRVIICNQNSNYYLKINILKKNLSNELGMYNLIHEVLRAITFNFNRDEFTTYLSKKFIPCQKDWDKQVSKLKDKFNNSLKKVVLARKVEYKTQGIINFANYFLDHSGKYSNSYAFYISLGPQNSFLSFSPEKFLKIINNELEIDAIAGSSTDAASLFTSKNITEHRYVSKQIISALQQIKIKSEITKNERPLDLGYIKHIHSKIIAKISSLKSLNTIILKLHPTPAVGGVPKEAAAKYIKEAENFNRGWYAAPVGIISYKRTELLVAIRSALQDHKNLHLYAGAGIIQDSVPSEEWIETEVKMSNLFISENELN